MAGIDNYFGTNDSLSGGGPAPTPPAGGMFNFPMDVFPSSSSGSSSSSWSGLPDEMQGFLTSLIPTMRESFTGFPEQRQQYYDQARQDLTQGYGDMQGYLSSIYGNKLAPQLQQTMNRLAGRNMIGSQVAGEALGQTATGVANTVMDQLAAMGLAKQKGLSELATREGDAMIQYPQLLSQLLGQGRISSSSGTSSSQQSDPSVPYRAALDFIGRMMA